MGEIVLGSTFPPRLATQPRDGILRCREGEAGFRDEPIEPGVVDEAVLAGTVGLSS